jgi:hypothetical protein
MRVSTDCWSMPGQDQRLANAPCPSKAATFERRRETGEWQSELPAHRSRQSSTRTTRRRLQERYCPAVERKGSDGELAAQKAAGSSLNDLCKRAVDDRRAAELGPHVRRPKQAESRRSVGVGTKRKKLNQNQNPKKIWGTPEPAATNLANLGSAAHGGLYLSNVALRP